MPGISGFELAERLNVFSPDTVIIFVSAYEEFVYSSFEYCPFRFLRKTHLAQELPDTLRKVTEKCLTDKAVLLFNTVDGEAALRLKDILFFEGQKNYYFIHTASGTVYKCRGTMDSVEELMENRGFFRVHAAFIVNLEHIESVDGSGFILMKSKKTVSLSKRRMPAFKDSYMKFLRRRIIQNEPD
jgi:DNA-binding LytR/AlgR family response regulator